ncbi:hypothetical protein B0H14DRAFT_2634426 [Mycena olivaceomarginata]|nr:hypothetical protein B0H14DRAFT_2634426 [Mycena olivaceomarginata]
MASADLSLLHVTCILDWRLGGWGPASRAHWDNSGALKMGYLVRDELVPRVGQPTVDYLNHICGLSDPTDIANWHEFCKTHENKKLRNWYAHKVQYPWLLPGYNESLSSFPKGYTISQPHQSLVESAHVASNKATKSNLLPGERMHFSKAADPPAADSTLADAGPSLDSTIPPPSTQPPSVRETLPVHAPSHLISGISSVSSCSVFHN